MARLETKTKKNVAPTQAQVNEAIVMVNRTNKGKSWMKWTPEEVLAKVTNVPEDGGAAVLDYIKEALPGLKMDAPTAGLAPADYIIGSIEKAITDGLFEFASEGEEELEYELVPVSQNEVKKALKSLLSTQSNIIASLYNKHTEVNEVIFNNKLSEPLITIERLTNRTLGNYTYGNNNIPIENHIRFNMKFVALNELERIHMTLKHEMIHQWQDQVLYAKADQTTFQAIEVPTRDTEGNIVFVPGVQKKRPREWHNADFKMMAAVVGIVCEGKHCGTGKANMPEPKSYNRKFRCMCIASNGYPMTIWSTRYVTALCTTCNFPYTEVIKDGRKGEIGGTIEVSKSHIELPNEDGVEKVMKETFSTFERFKTKALKDAFMDEEVLKDNPDAQHESGVYQKQHNAYTWGYHYWVAYNSTNMAEEVDKDDVEKALAPEPEAKNSRKKKPEAPAAPKRTGKIVKFPTAELPKAEEPSERTYSVDSPQDIIDLYKELGSVKAVGAKLGASQSTISGRVKKFSINFNEGTFSL